MGTVMYQKITKKLKFRRNLKLAAAVILGAGLAAAAFLLCRKLEAGAGVTAVCVLIPLLLAAGCAVWLLRLEKKLEKIKRLFQVQTDFEMDGALGSGTCMKEYYVLTSLYVVNFETLRAYPRSAVKRVTRIPGEYPKEKPPKAFQLKINVRSYPDDVMTFQTEAECAAMQMELFKQQEGREQR